MQQKGAVEPGSGWARIINDCSHKDRRCDCLPVASSEDGPHASSSEDGHLGLVEQLNKELDADHLNPIDEYAFLQIGGGALFLRPEPGKLAISQSIVKSLFTEARRSLTMREDCDPKSPFDILSSTRALLVVSGDHYTAWNLRKEYLLEKHKSGDARPAIKDEIVLLNLVFSMRPKAGNAWAHRRFACKLAVETMKDKELASFWEKELACCEELAVRHSKNYYGRFVGDFTVRAHPIKLTLLFPP